MPVTTDDILARTLERLRDPDCRAIRPDMNTYEDVDSYHIDDPGETAATRGCFYGNFILAARDLDVRPFPNGFVEEGQEDARLQEAFAWCGFMESPVQDATHAVEIGWDHTIAIVERAIARRAEVAAA